MFLFTKGKRAYIVLFQSKMIAPESQEGGEEQKPE